MKIMEQYIGQVVMISVLAVMTVLLILFSLMGFANEMGTVGRADYTYLAAITYTALRLPFQLYQLFPLSALLGTMLGLGMLANNSELIIVRAAGVSIPRIVFSVMKSMSLLILIVIFIGEVIAPPAQQYAVHTRLKALESKISLNTDYGLWARDGDTYIHVQRVENDGQLIGIKLYRFDEKYKMQSLLQAETGVFDGTQWVLNNAQQSYISDTGVLTRKIPELKWSSLLAPDLINVVSVKPETLSSYKLLGYIDYLKVNGLESAQYELALWNRLFMPFTIIAMVLIAVPFVFGSQRHGGIGQKIVLGFLIGMVFFIADRLAGQVGLVYNLPVSFAAALPTILVLTGAGWLFKRIR
jgi:lipopolysaccharide export system permease protein